MGRASPLTQHRRHLVATYRKVPNGLHFRVAWGYLKGNDDQGLAPYPLSCMWPLTSGHPSTQCSGQSWSWLELKIRAVPVEVGIWTRTCWSSLPADQSDTSVAGAKNAASGRHCGTCLLEGYKAGGGGGYRQPTPRVTPQFAPTPRGWLVFCMKGCYTWEVILKEMWFWRRGDFEGDIEGVPFRITHSTPTGKLVHNIFDYVYQQNHKSRQKCIKILVGFLRQTETGNICVGNYCWHFKINFI